MEHASGAFRFWPDQPGFLLSAFGWAAPAILELARIEPELTPRLLALDEARLHLFALAIAFAEDWPRPALARLLARGSDRAIVERTAGRRPPGVRRALGQLESRVMERERYGDLLDLLDDPTTAKALHHSRRTIVADEIRALKALPTALRSRALIEPFGPRIRVSHRLPEGLRHLVARGVAPDYDALVARLGALREPRQVAAEIRRMIESLPLALSLPPKRIGGARRLDDLDEIRRLAIEWRNCLRMYLDDVSSATCCLYRWRDDGLDLVCSVKRRGRLGWFLDHVEGARRAVPGGEILRRVENAFATAGVPEADVASALETVAEIADEDASDDDLSDEEAEDDEATLIARIPRRARL